MKRLSLCLVLGMLLLTSAGCYYSGSGHYQHRSHGHHYRSHDYGHHHHRHYRGHHHRHHRVDPYCD